MLEKVWDEKALVSEVNRLEALLSPFVDSSANFKANVESVRRFIKTRRAELTPELEGAVPTLNSKPLELAKRRIVGSFTGKFSTANGIRRPAGELSGTLWDQPITFRETSFDIQTADEEERIILQFVAVTATGQQHFIYLGIDSDSVTTGKPIAIDNTRIQGTFGFEGRYVGMLRGSMVLSKASKTGGELAGEFAVDVFSKQPKP